MANSDTEFCIIHSGNVGDCLWHLPSMIDIARRHGHSKFTLLLKVGVPGFYSSPHPCGNVLLTKSVAEGLIELLQGQTYLSDVRIWNDEEGLDMDKFRLYNVSSGWIATWPTQAYLCTPDLSKPWLSVYAKHTGKVLFNRTSRYRNESLDWRGLRGKAYFVGLEKENDTGLEWLPTPTLLSLAQEIAGCRYFLGNQSAATAIASALGVRHALEVCSYCPNVQPESSRCQMIWNQAQLDAVVRSL